VPSTRARASTRTWHRLPRASAPVSAPVLAAGAALVGCALVYVRDPNVPGSYGYCPFRALTGWDCPFCGSLRGYHALLHGHVGTALDYNVVTIAALPLVMWFWVLWWRRAARGDTSLPWRTDVAVIVFAVLLVFWVVRNLPGVPYLASSR
jgi:hypothetical protein